MRRRVKAVVESATFQRLVVGLIVANALVVGAETSTVVVSAYGELLGALNRLILWLFVAEVVLKIAAVWPRPSAYFRDPWNVFDFTVVAVSLLPAAGSFATAARLLRLLRVLRLVSALPELRLIVATLLRSIPSMGHVVALMSIPFYVYGVAGYHLFHEESKRERLEPLTAPVSREQRLRELRQTRSALERLEARLSGLRGCERFARRCEGVSGRGWQGAGGHDI